MSAFNLEDKSSVKYVCLEDSLKVREEECNFFLIHMPGHTNPAVYQSHFSWGCLLHTFSLSPDCPGFFDGNFKSPDVISGEEETTYAVFNPDLFSVSVCF